MLPTIALPAVPKAIFDIFRMEAGPRVLPGSKPLAAAALLAFAIGEAVLQQFDYPLGAGILFGLASAALLAATTFAVAHFTGNREMLLQFLIAAGAAGAAYAASSIALHLLFGLFLPPPLPTAKLLKFLLFPLLFWNWTILAFVYRHASLRLIPAFAVATIYMVFTNLIVSPLIK